MPENNLAQPAGTSPPPEQTSPQPEVPNNVPHEEKLNPDIVEQKRLRFRRRVRLGLIIAGILIVLAILTIAGTYIYNKTKSTYVTTEQPTPIDATEVIVVDPEPEIEEEKWDRFSSSRYEFSLEYPGEDFLEIDEDDEKEYFLKISFQDIVPTENATGENLVKGYMVTVNPLQITTSNADRAAGVKRESFLYNCPQSAYIGKVEDKWIDGIQGRGFYVDRCNSTYDVYYIPADDYIFEVILTYKGDLGFEQTYKTTSQLIRDSIDINLDSENVGPYIRYENYYNAFHFDYHRELDTGCCQVAYPPGERITQLIVLAESDNSNALGVFATRADRDDLDSFVENQKRILSDEYKVVKGFEPQGETTELTLSERRAIRLSGYSWKGNDLIYTYLPKSRSFLIFSHAGLGEEYVDQIFSSLNIYE